MDFSSYRFVQDSSIVSVFGFRKSFVPGTRRRCTGEGSGSLQIRVGLIFELLLPR